MAKKNEYGKYILSAGEIATYVVCPESWRLSQQQSVVEKVDTEQIKNSVEMHKEWSNNFKDAIYFTRANKSLIILLTLTIVFFIIKFFLG